MNNPYIKDVTNVYSPEGESLSIVLTSYGHTAQWTDPEGLGFVITEVLKERAEGVTITLKYDPQRGLVETIDLSRSQAGEPK